MASSSSSSSNTFFLIVYISLALLFSVSEGQSPTPPIASGLSFTFYNSTCPNLESIVTNHLNQAFQNDTGLAAGLLRLHFHDCFVQGCDASVLLDGSASGPSEQSAPPNLTLRPSAFQAINDLRALIDQACGGRVVSCADVVALAARDSVALSGGPNYSVPLGRRDSLTFASQSATLASLPAPTSNVTALLAVFANISLDVNDLVALSGGHTIGVAHCTSFTNRLYPTVDPNMDQTFAGNLTLTCPAANTTNTTVNDIRSPNVFDNKYYVNLVNRQSLFTSDQDLYSNSTTQPIVTGFAANQTLFFEKFVFSIVKMGQLSVLTGSQGEVRANCSAVNSAGGNEFLWSVVKNEGDGAAM